MPGGAGASGVGWSEGPSGRNDNPCLGKSEAASSRWGWRGLRKTPQTGASPPRRPRVRTESEADTSKLVFEV